MICGPMERESFVSCLAQCAHAQSNKRSPRPKGIQCGIPRSPRASRGNWPQQEIQDFVSRKTQSALIQTEKRLPKSGKVIKPTSPAH